MCVACVYDRWDQLASQQLTVVASLWPRTHVTEREEGKRGGGGRKLGRGTTPGRPSRGRGRDGRRGEGKWAATAAVGRGEGNEPSAHFPIPFPFSFSQISYTMFECNLNLNLNMNACKVYHHMFKQAS
jgi:hypothetical protein